MPDLILKKLTTFTGHYGAVYGLCEDSEGGFFSAGGDGFIVHWPTASSPADGSLIARAEKALFTCLYLSGQKLLIAGGLEGILYFIDVPAQKIAYAYKAHEKGIYSLLAAGDIVYSAGGDGYVRKWDTVNFKQLQSVALSSQAIRHLEVFDDCLLAGSSDGKIYTFEPDTLNILNAIEAHQSSVFSLAVNSRHVYSGGRDAHLKIWHTSPEFSATKEIKAHLGTVNSLCLHNEWIISAGRDKFIKIWDVDGRLAESKGPVTGGHFHSVNKVISHHASGILLSCADDKSIIAWQSL